jgi:TRAP-type C4-dicarboxylate transport system permease small subunit
MNLLLRWLARGARLAEMVSVGMFMAIFVLFIAAVVMRYLFVRPIEWADEYILVLFLWTTFLTEALVLSEREQVTFDVVYDLCGPAGRRGIGLAASALVTALFLLAMPTVFSYITFLWREKTPVMEWRLDFVFACFMVYWVAVCVRAIARFAALCGPRWREHVASTQPDERANVLG